MQHNEKQVREKEDDDKDKIASSADMETKS
jgi:hypothetical protein